jgi:hypothetical protein
VRQAGLDRNRFTSLALQAADMPAD